MDHNLRSIDAWAKQGVATSAGLQELAEIVLGYLVAGHLTWRGSGRARVRYPGRPSSNGLLCDEIEGFSRLAPAISAWIGGDHGPRVVMPPGVTVDLGSVLSEGLWRGTQPTSSEYWGQILAPDQRVCEAADIALAAWLARDVIECSLDRAGMDALFQWLAGALRPDVKDNNWHLFPLMVDAACRSFDRDGMPSDQRKFHTERLLAMHCGEGWFRDGPNGHFDYYNSWGFHHGLYWLDRMGFPLGGISYQEFAEPFFESFKWLFTPTGYPIYGRSVCYRMAAPAGLLTAALATGQREKIGLAIRAVECTWRHFVSRGALDNGMITAGYYGEDYRLMDGYSCAASALWSLRSLIPVLFLPPGSAARSAATQPLPVEVADFSVTAAVPEWTIEGFKRSGRVELRVGPFRNNDEVRERKGLRRSLRLIRDRVTGRGFGQPLKDLAYNQGNYSSDRPFWLR